MLPLLLSELSLVLRPPLHDLLPQGPLAGSGRILQILMRLTLPGSGRSVPELVTSKQRHFLFDAFLCPSPCEFHFRVFLCFSA